MKSELDAGYIDTLLISFPPGSTSADKQEVWQRAEECVSDSSVVNAGVCDMDKPELEELYDWAQVGYVIESRLSS